MIKDITIGQYFPGNSPLHRLDARMKIILTLALAVSIFLCKNFFALGFFLIVTAVLVAMSKIPFKTILKSIKPLAIIILITAFLNIFYGKGEPLFSIGRFAITRSGIETAVFMAFRIIILVVVTSLLTYTTSPTQLTDALERLMKPLKLLKIDTHAISMTMTIALRFIPTLVEEIDKIMSAQKSRGADMDSGNIINKVKALIPVLIPLFVSSFRRANELAYAMECRCYRGGEGRTKMKVMKLSVGDFAALAIVGLIIAAIVLMNIYLSDVI